MLPQTISQARNCRTVRLYTSFAVLTIPHVVSLYQAFVWKAYRIGDGIRCMDTSRTSLTQIDYSGRRIPDYSCTQPPEPPHTPAVRGKDVRRKFSKLPERMDENYQSANIKVAIARRKTWDDDRGHSGSLDFVRTVLASQQLTMPPRHCRLALLVLLYNKLSTRAAGNDSTAVLHLPSRPFSLDIMMRPCRSTRQ